MGATKFSAKNQIGGIFICDSLLNRSKIDPFLKWIVTGDEM